MQRTMDCFFRASGGPKKRKGAEGDGQQQPSSKKVKERVDAGEASGGKAPASSEPQLDRAQVSRAIALMLTKTRQVREKVQEVRAAGNQPQLKDLLACESWREALGDQFSKKYFENLERFVQGEWRAKVQVFPQPWDIFRALNACPPSNVKVVILGQDPYHNVGQAMGLSFSVPKGIQTPSSLRNIYKELSSDLGADKFAIPKHGNLERWAAQGVLLLNAVLTVRAHQAGSHSKKGWEAFTEEIIKTVSSQESHVVFMLWGKWAQERGRLIRNAASHCILKCPHPSGLSAHRGFYGCKHFSQANKYLLENKKPPVDWQV